MLVQMSTESAQTTCMHWYKFRTPADTMYIVLVGRSSLSIDVQLGSMDTRIACLLHSFTVSSCSCCVDPSVKLLRNLLRADLSSGEIVALCLYCIHQHLVFSDLIIREMRVTDIQIHRYTHIYTHKPTTVCPRCMRTKA